MVGRGSALGFSLSYFAPHEAGQVAKFLLTSKQALGSDNLCGVQRKRRNSSCPENASLTEF